MNSNIIFLICIISSALSAQVIERLRDFDVVANSPGAVSVVFDDYIPDTDGTTNGAHFVQAGTFTGFVTGTNQQLPVGLIVSGSKSQVVFADYYSALTTSDIAGGDFLSTVYPDSGNRVTFTFVNVSNPAIITSVSRVAFELAAVDQGDNVSVLFWKADGTLLHQSAYLTAGRYGYIARSETDTREIDAIHRIELLSNGIPPQLWTIGHPGDSITADFAFAHAPLISVHQTDNDTAVSEQNTSSDTYTIALNGAAPLENVRIILQPDDPNQIVLSVDSTPTGEIVFTGDNYHQSRMVTVTAVDDTASEATHYTLITHMAVSADSAYNHVPIDDVRVKITDNDGNGVKVFLIAGQSNAAGSGLNSDFPADYQQSQYDVEFWVGGRLPGDGVPDYAAWDRLADTAFKPLAPGSGNYQAATHSGFELSLGCALKDALPNEPITIIKYAMSGSALQRGLRSSDGAGDWDTGPPIWNQTYDGVRYHVFMHSAVIPALKAITDRGDVPEMAALFWMQGETDSGNLVAAQAYQSNLHKLIASVRSDVHAPDMQFIAGRVRPVMGAYNGIVRTAIQNVAENDSLVQWIDTDDLAVNSDNIHYSATGLTRLGQRFAEAYLTMLPLPGDLQLDGQVDLIDFAQFANHWLMSDCGLCERADLTSDLIVDSNDLLILVNHWLNTR